MRLPVLLALPAVLLGACGAFAQVADAPWLGRFVSGDARLSIGPAVEPGLLSVEGRACIACGEAGERVGRFQILGRPSGRLMLLVETESGAFSAEAPPEDEATCVLALKRRPDGAIEALDNGGCGGASVSFDGTYRPGG